MKCYKHIWSPQYGLKQEVWNTLCITKDIQDSSEASRELGQPGQGEDREGDQEDRRLPDQEGTVSGASCSGGYVSIHGHTQVDSYPGFRRKGSEAKKVRDFINVLIDGKPYFTYEKDQPVSPEYSLSL